MKIEKSGLSVVTKFDCAEIATKILRAKGFTDTTVKPRFDDYDPKEVQEFYNNRLLNRDKELSNE